MQIAAGHALFLRRLGVAIVAALSVWAVLPNAPSETNAAAATAVETTPDTASQTTAPIRTRMGAATASDSTRSGTRRFDSEPSGLELSGLELSGLGPSGVGLSGVVPSGLGLAEPSDSDSVRSGSSLPKSRLSESRLSESGADSPRVSSAAAFDVSGQLEPAERLADTNGSAAAPSFGPVTSPDVGDHCMAGFDAADLTEFFANPIGSFQGADYQRAFRLADGRVLWTFQDAFVSGTLVHNVGMVQSGRCFTMLNTGARSWLLGDITSHMEQWQWIFDGAMNSTGTEFHLFVVQMNETGSSYLSRTRPTTVRRVVLDATSLDVIEVVEEAPAGDDLYGWGVTSDGDHTYLYSHCYQQFGYETMLGWGACASDVKLARIPLGQFDAAREYWDGSGWASDHEAAVPVIDESFVGSGNNPAQVRFDGERYVMVVKDADWWGETVEFGVSDVPQGPFTSVASVDEPLKCDRSVCNTYFASWIPWTDGADAHVWSIGHNRWDGAETFSHLSTYRPTFHTVTL